MFDVIFDFVCAYGFDVGGIVIKTCTALMSGLHCIVRLYGFDVGTLIN